MGSSPALWKHRGKSLSIAPKRNFLFSVLVDVYMAHMAAHVTSYNSLLFLNKVILLGKYLAFA